MQDLDNETLSYTRENLDAGTTHYLRVRSFIEVEGTRYLLRVNQDESSASIKVRVGATGA